MDTYVPIVKIAVCLKMSHRSMLGHLKNLSWLLGSNERIRECRIAIRGPRTAETILGRILQMLHTHASLFQITKLQ